MAIQNFNNVKTEPITGESTIIHSTRVKLKLTCDEYILADLFRRAEIAKKSLNPELIFKKIGYNIDETTLIIQSLYDKSMLIPNIDIYKSKVTKLFDNAFGSLEQEFEEFWHVNGKSFWPGGKTETFKAYKKARIRYKFEFIMKVREAYISMLASQPYRQRMIATRFLNSELDNDFTIYNEKLPEKEKTLSNQVTINHKALYDEQ